MKKNPIPDAIWEQHVAILAKPGRGKTVTAKGGAARLMKQGLRVGAVDPTAAWWGMRLKADGVTPAYPMVIFGGDHADIPLDANLGLLGEKVGAMVGDADWSWIIDTSTMGKDARTNFFIGFAEALFATNRRRLNLFLDECHLFIPQQKAPGRAAKHMLDAGNNLISGGRGRGFCVTMISQRPAKVHKDSLTATESVIALGMLAPQDINAVRDWVKVQGDLDAADAMIRTLPSLPVGEGWVYAPGLNLLDRMKFPMIETYDSSKAPDAKGVKTATTVMAQVNIEEIRAQLAPPRRAPARGAAPMIQKPSSVEAKVKEKNEAAALREREAAFAAGARDARGAAFEEGFFVGHKQGFELGVERTMRAIRDQLQTLVVEPVNPAKVPKSKGAIPSPSRETVAAPKPNGSQIRAPQATRTSENGRSLPSPQQRILDSLATWQAMGHAAPSNAQVAWLANYSPTSTGYTNPRSALKTGGLVEYPAPDKVALTPDGIRMANVMTMQGSLLDYVLGQLSGPEQRILSSVWTFYPDDATNDDVAAGANYSASSTGYTNPRSSLKTKELITYPGPGRVRAADWLATED